MQNICKNCQVRIVKVNFALGGQWMHQPEGALLPYEMYEFCKMTVAEPNRLKKQCLYLSIHAPHEWVLRHPSQGPGETLCLCEGNKVDLRIKENEI